MTDPMHGITEDVPFNFAAASDLATACDGAASVIESQLTSRSSLVTTAMTDFEGYFGKLFHSNAHIGRADAHELITALRHTATGARKLSKDAKDEQARRVKAREWKHHHDHRSLLEKGWDGLTGGDDCPIPNPAPVTHYSPPQPTPKPRKTPQPGSASGGSGTTSARPANLRSFAKGSATDNHTLSTKATVAKAAYSHFESTCHWGTLSAAGVFSGFHKWLAENDNDVRWANTVAAAFEKAGGEGGLSTLPNSAIDAALKAAHVDETREDLVIQMPSALGHPPTTGYSNDPVNTSTGNFIETEQDVEFLEAAAELSWNRSYNSLSRNAGAFGTGWTSWTETGLTFDDEAAYFTGPDGRQLTFPRLGDGWDRAIGESQWLARVQAGDDADGAALVARDNQGTRWGFTESGRPLWVDHGPGTRVTLEWEQAEDGDRLTGLTHARGRSLHLEWGVAAGTARVVALRASDGRRVDYSYDESGRLVAAHGPLGTRAYRWNDDDLISAVIDADGVVEAENTYDEWGRVVRQRSPHGRTTRFVYLPGQITVVSDENGERSNTWIADDAGRLVGVVDADEQRASFAYDAHGSPVLATERDGSTTVTEYDQRGRKIRQVLPSGADFVYAYDDADRVVRVDVASGGPLDDDDASVSVTAYEYSGDERNPSVVHDPEGGRTEMVWSQGLLQQVVDPTGVVVHFEHDDHGDLVATIDAEGNAARLERDGVGRVTTAITPSGARTGFTYDESNGLLSARIDPDGARWTYEYTTGGRMTAVIDPAGARTVIERDSATGDETRSVDPLGRVVSRSYDDLGNLSEVRLPDGSGWAFTHDALSRVREITNPGGGTVTADYDIVGAPTTISDPTGVRTEISTDPGTGRVVSTDGVASSGAEVDRLGRLVGEVQPDGSTVLTRYDRCGRPVEVVDPSGALTRIERDAGGRVVTQILPSGAEIGHTYDSCGRLTTVTDPTGATTRYVYDADGRVVEQISPTGDVATSRYDECGRLLARRIPGVGTFTYAYDACSRVIESRDPANGRRRFSYDAAGQLVATIDGNGGRTTYDYDLNGRCTTITHPDGGVTRREFDANNRCIAETDPLGRTTTAEYDAAGRQTVQVDPEGRRTEWSYDPRTGLLASMSVDGVEVQQIERDIPGRRVRVTDRANPRGEVTVHELAWDERGQLTSRTRDGRGLSWAYNADGACTSMTTPDGHTTSYARDGAGRILGVSHPLLGDVLLERDAVGRTTSAVATGPDGSRSGSQSWTYAAGFLTTHLQKGPDGSTRTVLDHDDVGRINTISVENPDGSAGRTSYSYDEAGQLLAAQTGESTLRWSYDSCGRLVREIHDSAGQQVSRRFDYDLAGQLRTITVGGQVVSTYTHDGAGRRTSETHADGSRRDYGWSPAGWLASLTQTDRIGDTTRTDIIVDALGELAYINDTEFFSDTAHPYAGLVGTATDPIIGAGPYTGTTAGWSSPGWRDARAVSADPWALPPVPATDAADYQISPTGDLLIGGHQGSDPLEWLTNRVYDAATRSFCSVDPIAATVGAGWAANPYSYAGNDPLHALDPLGLHPVTDAELRAYNANNGGLISGATHWLKNNWEYVAGAAMVIGGGILIATGVGGPAGMMLLSAGADTIIQKATTGHVNWGEVAVSGVLGGIGGGAATWAARASEGGVAALRTSMIVNGAVGATGSETMYVIRNHGHLTVQGMLGAGVAGGVTGAVGGAAGPAGGTIAKNLGATATGPLAKTATGVINFGGGFSGNVAGSLVSGDDVNIVHAAETGGLSTAGGIAGDRFGPPSTGTSTLKQMSYFGTRTVRGVFNAGAHNTQALWGSAGIGTGVGLVGP